MMQQARKLVAAEWLPAPLSCDLTFQLIQMLSEQAREARLIQLFPAFILDGSCMQPCADAPAMRLQCPALCTRRSQPSLQHFQCKPMCAHADC